MGADLSDVMPELRIIWIQALCYFVLTLAVYRFQFYEARRYAMDRLKFLKHKREVNMTETKEV
jgi:ABC-2 type transport system permease protein